MHQILGFTYLSPTCPTFKGFSNRSIYWRRHFLQQETTPANLEVLLASENTSSWGDTTAKEETAMTFIKQGHLNVTWVAHKSSPHLGPFLPQVAPKQCCKYLQFLLVFPISPMYFRLSICLIFSKILRSKFFLSIFLDNFPICSPIFLLSFFLHP